MKYQVAERFKSVQGEGVFSGTPMAFIRFVGCSVGKKICQHCDTDFERTLPWRGGGSFTERDLWIWAHPYRHICLTGGEPFDQDLLPIFEDNESADMFHIETSGTRPLPDWWDRFATYAGEPGRGWLCVSPKPGFLEDTVAVADEIKVIVPGLGNGEGWPSLEDAIRWAHWKPSRPVFLQPRNGRFDVDKQNLLYVQDLIKDNPELRLSVQLHKILKVQ